MNFLITRRNAEFDTSLYSYIRNSASYSFYSLKDRCKIYKISDSSEAFIIGDCINPNVLFPAHGFSADLLKYAKGIFYLIILRGDQISVYSSNFSILPVYFSEKLVAISSSLELINSVYRLSESVNYRFILESFLFNYPFSGQTLHETVKRLPTFTAIHFIYQKFSFEQYENVFKWFPSSINKTQKLLESLASLFLQQVENYFSSEKNAITFTSGFDSRTLVSAAIKYNADFFTFSLGKPENKDVFIPMANSKVLRVPFRYFDLSGTKFQDKYYLLGGEMSRRTGGFNGFLYPHFLFGAKEISSESKYLITGYCGSELLRALHIHGAVTSKELVDIFRIKDDNVLYDSLWDSPKLKFLDKVQYKDVFNKMMDEILLFRNNRPSGISSNQFFYYFIFTEVFRKVFGSWTMAQFNELNVRIPFLDYTFIQELLKTDLAGCNNDFFVHNPFKRLKGQLLYAEIIRQSNLIMYDLITGKGYKPADLVSLGGKIRIVLPYVKKRILRNKVPENLDNLGLVSGYLTHLGVIEKSFEKLNSFDIPKLLETSRSLSKYTPEVIRDRIFQSASFASIL